MEILAPIFIYKFFANTVYECYQRNILVSLPPYNDQTKHIFWQLHFMPIWFELLCRLKVKIIFPFLLKKKSRKLWKNYSGRKGKIVFNVSLHIHSNRILRLNYWCQEIFFQRVLTMYWARCKKTALSTAFVHRGIECTLPVRLIYTRKQLSYMNNMRLD